MVSGSSAAKAGPNYTKPTATSSQRATRKQTLEKRASSQPPQPTPPPLSARPRSTQPSDPPAANMSRPSSSSPTFDFLNSTKVYRGKLPNRSVSVTAAADRQPVDPALRLAQLDNFAKHIGAGEEKSDEWEPHRRALAKDDIAAYAAEKASGDGSPAPVDGQPGWPFPEAWSNPKSFSSTLTHIRKRRKADAEDEGLFRSPPCPSPVAKGKAKEREQERGLPGRDVEVLEVPSTLGLEYLDLADRQPPAAAGVASASTSVPGAFPHSTQAEAQHLPAVAPPDAGLLHDPVKKWLSPDGRRWVKRRLASPLAVPAAPVTNVRDADRRRVEDEGSDSDRRGSRDGAEEELRSDEEAGSDSPSVRALNEEAKDWYKWWLARHRAKKEKRREGKKKVVGEETHPNRRDGDEVGGRKVAKGGDDVVRPDASGSRDASMSSERDDVLDGAGGTPRTTKETGNRPRAGDDDGAYLVSDVDDERGKRRRYRRG
ncbi:hypothetical protein CONLIGDRAFT_650696 [Coniochaeta ligniaria NRRL 30616]|uniref:Uncharacterized protein n=1 Tax=Coniochaeta ligniaria NRRL 30616 TaxID=1408157 RepID=A0A1J7IZF2_9PEZI|nr:hypothetical protein CONLIGDRAFT_650696 [Coniochaeta ligniaria NRRL 30616]